MAIFQGRYSWDGKKERDREPISWFPGAYDLTIVTLPATDPGVVHLRPHMCLFTNTGSGYSVSANPENFAKRICDDFSLEIEKVLWVEKIDRNKEEYDIITFRKSGHLGENAFYTMKKRKPIGNELNLIKQNVTKHKQ